MPDPNTTLRYEGNRYSLQFTTIHKAIWKGMGIQLSIVFTASDKSIFHICIPLENTSLNQNNFLRTWLDKTPFTPPPGMTYNEILNVSSKKVNYAMLQYCITYNNAVNPTKVPYTLCIFSTPINYDFKNNSWINTIANTYGYPTNNTVKYRPNTFDEIFNLVFRDTVHEYVNGKRDINLLSTEPHLDVSGNQTSVIPVFYNVNLHLLTGYKTSKVGTRGLSNVKCYPIDLANQVDSNGNIFIDESTNKPVDVKSLESDESSAAGGISVQLQQAKTANNIRFIVIIVIFSLIGLAVLLSLVVYLFQGTTSTAAAAPAEAQAVAEPMITNATVKVGRNSMNGSNSVSKTNFSKAAIPLRANP